MFVFSNSITLHSDFQVKTSGTRPASSRAPLLQVQGPRFEQTEGEKGSPYLRESSTAGENQTANKQQGGSAVNGATKADNRAPFQVPERTDPTRCHLNSTYMCTQIHTPGKNE